MFYIYGSAWRVTPGSNHDDLPLLRPLCARPGITERADVLCGQGWRIPQAPDYRQPVPDPDLRLLSVLADHEAAAASLGEHPHRRRGFRIYRHGEGTAHRLLHRHGRSGA